uniref:hypothetical protein n=1 Tax=Thermaerobacillus caldiproteolyticus TaxID=247480 RepID=UPI00215D7266|nr:hypothetical protein [Anoxybacillus caldiproteolyticus]
MEDALLEEIHEVLHAPNKQTTRLLLKQSAGQMDRWAPKALQILEDATLYWAIRTVIGVTCARPMGWNG